MSWGPAAISGGISLLGSLFGGKRKPSAYEQQQAALAQQQGNLASTEQGYGANAYGDYQDYNNKAKTATNDYADLLKQNPFTDQYKTALLAGMTAGDRGDAMAAQSSLAASLAQRGLSADGSTGTGGQTAITNATNADIANARLGIYGQEMGSRDSRAAALQQLLSGTANGYSGRAESWNGQAMGGYGNAGSQYGNLASEDYSRQNAWNQQQGQNAGIYGQLGGLLAGAMTPKPTRATPYLNAVTGMENSFEPGINPSYGTGVPVPQSPAPGVPKLPHYRF